MTAFADAALVAMVALVFVAGVFFGAWLQRRVSHGLDVRMPGRLFRSKSSVESDSEEGYETPYRGYDL